MRKFEQFKSLYHSLCSYDRKGDYSKEQVTAVTSDFDRLFELFWKTLKEYLFADLGIREAKTGSPKEILKLAYREGLLKEADIWVEMLKDRNNDTHMYSIIEAWDYKGRIEDIYLPEMKQAMEDLSALIELEEMAYVSVPESLAQFGRDCDEGFVPLVAQLCEFFHVSENELYKNWDSYYREIAKARKSDIKTEDGFSKSKKP